VKIEQKLQKTYTYALFVYTVRSQVTRNYYLRRLRIFFNYSDLQTDLQWKQDAIIL